MPHEYYWRMELGRCSFPRNNWLYFSLYSFGGIPLYAIREIARVRNDKTLCSKTAIEILLLHSVLTLAGYAVVYVLVATVAKIQVDIPLFLLLSTNLFFTAIGAVWFYQG